MKIVAALAVAALLIVAFAQGYKTVSQGGRFVSAKNGGVSTSNIARTPYGSINWQVPLTGDSPDALSLAGTPEDEDGISHIAENVIGALVGSYATLAESGSYTTEEGEKIAKDIAGSLKASVSYEAYDGRDIKTDADISYERMLAYRNDLRIALEPLLKNPGYELELFATYIETHDARYLEQLKSAAKNYRAGIENTANIVVPEDALSEHIGVLNALSEFAAVVERLTEYSDDPFASAALLRTYNETELRLFSSFDALATYEKQKQS
ncbi:hypothetical protein HYW60_01805 [Candidatus Kaiserbacteria bacterium]|nr:hypothetical protein [Candidatus Kaiserbacteria bacterium]